MICCTWKRGRVTYLPEMANVMAVTKYAIAKIAQKADWGDV
jgi:hypothetical protein